MRRIIFIFLAVIVFSCKHYDSSEKKMFFSEYKGLGTNSRNQEVLKIDSLFLLDNNPIYKFEFNSWHGILINDIYNGLVPSLKGYLLIEKNKVYFKSSAFIQRDTNELLFDFDMSIGNKHQCYSTSNKMAYSVELSNKFINKKDTIYKFKYPNASILNHRLDLVCYIDKYKGVLGMYLSFYDELNNEDEMYSYIGKIYDYAKLKQYTR